VKKILVIDNYDSFVYNLVQYIGELEPEADIVVYKNDKVSASKLRRLSPTHVIISPGPGRPEKAGVSVEVVRTLGKSTPILGVCLGHQAIAVAFGGKVVRAKRVLHGKTSRIHHVGTGIFEDLPNPMIATRYHSLVVYEASLPEELVITARSEEDDEIMAVQHVKYPVFGVQFHPESILTDEGKKLLKNFLSVGIGKSEEMGEGGKPVIGEKSITECTKRVLEGHDLSYEETLRVMEEIMSGAATDAQIAGFLVAMRMKGETGEELSGMAKVMQEKSIRINTFSPITVDTCGTGGDGAGTFNISTATAFVVSAGGVPVAKHGNRSVSSKVGSADVLEAGGYGLQKKPSKMEEELKNTGFTFLFAPLLHPAMKYVMPARKQLKVRTAFNLLGPVTNPARVKYQILGVFDFEYAHRLGKVLQTLGTSRSAVVSGGFTDELTTCGENKVLVVTRDDISLLQLDVEAFGLHRGDPEELKGRDDPLGAFQELREVLAARTSRVRVETVALNAGMLFWIVGDTSSIKDGVEKALDLMVSKKALHKLEEVMAYQHPGHDS